MTFIFSKVLSGPPSPRWRSDSRNLCQAFVTRTRAVTTVSAVSSYSLKVNPCDSAPARYSFGTDDFFSDDDLRRSVSILASGISSADMRDPGRHRKQRSYARSKKRLALFRQNSRFSSRRRNPTPTRMALAYITSFWFAAGPGRSRI
jgi:hypothetical protein